MVWERARSSSPEGKGEVSRKARKSKRRVAISKRIIERSITSVQVQKKWNEVPKKCFPYNTYIHTYIHTIQGKATQ